MSGYNRKNRPKRIKFSRRHRVILEMAYVSVGGWQ